MADRTRVWSTFDGARGPDGKVRSCVWDRVCVPGNDEKDGQKTEFTRETLSQMVDNFVQRGDMIPLDANHQSNYAHINGMPAPALAFYGALAVVWGGEIVKLGCAEGVTATGTEEGLDLSKDGLWAYRCEVTEFGDQMLPNFKLTSPTFTSDGTLRDGTSCGYCLAAVAATNTPWQGGTSLTFEGMGHYLEGEVRVGSVIHDDNGAFGPAGSKYKVTEKNTQGVRLSNGKTLSWNDLSRATEITFSHSVGMKPTQTKGATAMAKAKFAKFAGAADGADDAAIKSALSAKTAELAKSAMEDEAFKYDEAAKELEDMAGEMDGDAAFADDCAKMQRMAQKFRRMAKFDGEMDGEMDGGNSAGPKPGLVPGNPAKAPPMTEVSKPGTVTAEGEMDDKEKKEAEFSALRGTVDSLKNRLAKFERAEADREAAVQKEREAQFSKLAKDAQTGGWKGDAKALIAFARTNYAEARKLVESFLPAERPAHLFDRYTSQGGPAGAPTNGREYYAPAKPRAQRTPFGTFVESDGEFADEVRKLAESKDPILMAKVDGLIGGAESEKALKFNRLLAAGKIVRAERPDLAESAE